MWFFSGPNLSGTGCLKLISFAKIIDFTLKTYEFSNKNSITKWQNPTILWKMCFLRVKWHPSYFSLKSKKVCNKSCCIWFSVVKISILSPFFAIYNKKLLKNTFLLNKSIESDKMILPWWGIEPWSSRWKARDKTIGPPGIFYKR